MDIILGLGYILAMYGVPIAISWAIGGWMFGKGTFTDLIKSIFKSILFIYIIGIVLITIVGVYNMGL